MTEKKRAKPFEGKPGRHPKPKDSVGKTARNLYRGGLGSDRFIELPCISPVSTQQV